MPVLADATYDDLFNDLGEIIEVVNRMVNSSDSFTNKIETQYTELSEQFTTNVRGDLLTDVKDAYDDVKATILSEANSISNLATARLLHTSLLDELPELGEARTSINAVLRELTKAMVFDNKTVKQGTAPTITVTRNLTSDRMNSGEVNVNGDLKVCNKLSSYKAPSSGWSTNNEYYEINPDGGTDPGGVISELAYDDEDITLECVSDKALDGVTHGFEQWRVIGEPRRSMKWDYKNTGTGSGGSITSVQSSNNLLPNGDFTDWESKDGYGDGDFQLPVGWFQLDTSNHGVPGTNINIETDVSNNLSGFQGICFEVLAEEGVDDKLVEIRTTLPRRLIKPRTAYACTGYVKGNSSSPDVIVKLVETGKSGVDNEDPPGADTDEGHFTNLLSMENITTAYALNSNDFVTDKIVPEQLDIVIRWWVGDSSEFVYLDYFSLVELQYFGGLAPYIVAGKNPWFRGDRFKYNVSHSSRGVFQEFFREKYHIQLPSSDSPSTSDDLASD